MSMADTTHQIDTSEAISIAIPMDFNQTQPNHFGAEVATKEALAAGDFIGDTTRGGSCNVDSITMVPHCNGTHTESVGHIVHENIPIGENISDSLSICQVISISPINAANTLDTYLPDLQHSDKVIDLESIQSHLDENKLNDITALVIRTLPNNRTKLSCTYNADNQGPFFTHQAISWLANSKIQHLLVDMPSIDKMYDDGQLSNHHIFWGVNPNSRLLNDHSKIKRTITEMVYLDDTIDDGLYCLNLQIPAFKLDAAPSRPILYPIKIL